MKHLRIVAVVACAALSLAACATAGSGTTTGPPGPVVSGQNTALDEKALIAAELAYNSAATAYLAADQRGLLTAAQRKEWGGRLITAYDALKLARQAYAAGNASTFVEQLARVTILADQVRRGLPPRPD